VVLCTPERLAKSLPPPPAPGQAPNAHGNTRLAKHTEDTTRTEEAGREQAERIFDEALSRPEAARGQFVAAECGDDPEMRSEVEAMLLHYDSTRGALHQETASHQLRAGAHSDAPPRIGSAEVLDTLPSDGPIQRWATCRDTAPREGVLALLRGVLTHDARRRLTWRAEALGRAQHGVLARVLELGSVEAGRGAEVFLMHEQVDGVPPLTKGAESVEELQRMLERFAVLCDGLEELHRRGLFHGRVDCAVRLVDDGTFRLAEPGFAGLLAALPLDGSDFEPLPGPRNGAPEWSTQPGWELDGRVDIYAIGQLLEGTCGSLEGRLPHQVRGLVERCLSPDRDERPRSGGAMADALRGLLQDEQHAVEQEYSPRRLMATVVLCLVSAAAGLALGAWLFSNVAVTSP